MQTARENMKRWTICLVSISLAIYVCFAILASPPSEFDGRCDYYTEKLNGGLKEYQGQKFMVKLCGEDRHHGWFSDGNDEIWLEVFNEKGDLLAKRTFFIHWDVYFDRKIEYHPDHLSYIDDSSDKIKKLSMPPTTIDWIRARIPLLD